MALSNSRSNPIIGGAVSWNAITGEAHTVAQSTEWTGFYVIRLNEQPQAGSVTISGYTEIASGLPASGEFWVDTEPTGLIFFHSSADTASVSVDYNGGGSVASVENIQTLLQISPAQRQTIIQGPVTSAGVPNFLPSTSVNLNLTSQNISTGIDSFVVSAGNGFGENGESNQIGISTANLTWTGLTASRAAATPNYLYVTVSGGALATGHTVLPPIVQLGGTPSTTSGQFTYDWTKKIGYLGNGTTAPQAYVVFVGEAATDGTTVISTVMYGYNLIGKSINIEDRKATTTAGGSSVAGTQTRDLNTLIDNFNTGIVSLSSNDVTLLSGVYEIEASAPAHKVSRHCILLADTSNVIINDILGNNAIGTSEYSNTAADYSATKSNYNGVFVFSSLTTFRLRHYTQSVNATQGLGVESSSGYAEVYSRIKITKIG